MNLLVIGASGLVGSHVLRVAKEHGHTVVGTYRNFALPGLQPLEITDHAAVQQLTRQVKPDAVVCCAAWSWVDGCEKDPERALRENRDSPRALAEAARRAGARFLHFSSSYVFDGTAGPYGEEDATCPLSVYGHAKLAGEDAVSQACEGSAVIVRTMGVYGEEAQRKNFVCQVIDNLSAGKRMRVPTDQIGNTSYAGDLAEGVLRLLETGARGIWNLGGPDPDVRRSDFALRIAREYQLDESLFDFLSTRELAQPAPRPLHGGLKIDKARSALDWHSREWKTIPRVS